jgi:hypothetical protein
MIKEQSLSSLPRKFCRTEIENLKKKKFYSPTAYVALCDRKYVRLEECLHSVGKKVGFLI